MFLASVDLGSNSFRLEIGRVEGHRVIFQKYWKEGVRLAAGIDEHGMLTEEAQNNALKTLVRFNELIRNFEPEHVRAVGTQALRIAKNTPQFLEKAQKALGFPIEILRGHEEARLVFEGCSYRLPPSDAKRLIVDIGGGSTELVIGVGHKAHRCESFHIGCVNITLDYFPDGIINEEHFEKALIASRSEITEAFENFNVDNWDEAYGSSGTMDAICTILRTQGVIDAHTVTLEQLLDLKAEIIRQGSIDQLSMPGLDDSRREVIVGGLVVLLAVFRTLKITSMTACSGALRVGLLYGLLDRHSNLDIREESAQALLEMSHSDLAQALRVQKLSLALFSELGIPCSDEDIKLLGWASLLHEVGSIISHNGYHHHTAYILGNSDLAGFSRSNQDQLARLTLGQRGNLAKVEPYLANPITTAQLLCLRLATIFAHNRIDVELPEHALSIQGRTITLRIDPQWMQTHPLTHFLLENEINIWEKVQYNFVLTVAD